MAAIRVSVYSNWAVYRSAAKSSQSQHRIWDTKMSKFDFSTTEMRGLIRIDRILKSVSKELRRLVDNVKLEETDF